MSENQKFVLKSPHTGFSVLSMRTSDFPTWLSPRLFKGRKLPLRAKFKSYKKLYLLYHVP